LAQVAAAPLASGQFSLRKLSSRHRALVAHITRMPSTTSVIAFTILGVCHLPASLCHESGAGDGVNATKTSQQATLSNLLSIISGTRLGTSRASAIAFVDKNIHVGCTTPKQIALTFDDGPSGKMTTDVLDVLDEKDAKGTFFQLGKGWGTDCTDPRNYQWCDKLWKRMLDKGHTIGYHSWRHDQIPSTPMETLQLQTSSGQLTFARSLGQHPIFFRPPHGNDGAGSDQANFLQERGYRMVNWNVHTWDWKYVADKVPPNSAAVHRVVEVIDESTKSGDGSIALMHDPDSFEWIKFFPEIVDKLKANGYSLVDMSTCLGASQEEAFGHDGIDYDPADKNGGCAAGLESWTPPLASGRPICVSAEVATAWKKGESSQFDLRGTFLKSRTLVQQDRERSGSK